AVADRPLRLRRAPRDRPGDAEAVRGAGGRRVRGLRGGGAAGRWLGGPGGALPAAAPARPRAAVRRLLPRVGRTGGPSLRGLAGPRERQRATRTSRRSC